MNNEMRASLEDIDDTLAGITNRIADAARIEDEIAGELWDGELPGFKDADRTQELLHQSMYSLQNALNAYRRAMKCKR